MNGEVTADLKTPGMCVMRPRLAAITYMLNKSGFEIVAPHLLKSRTVGLCGDMNGEVTADLKTPGMCVMRPRLAAITYMLNKSGSESGFERCSGLSGLPTGLKQ